MEHVKTQNWFAVVLDFLIVVAGILIAFQITNWSESRQQMADYRRAEKTIKNDLRTTYWVAKERKNLQDCRVEQVSKLSKLLLEPGDVWLGVPLKEDKAQIEVRSIPQVLRAPMRGWGSRVWNVELSRGTFDQMEPDLRDALDGVFQSSADAKQLQDQISVLHARLKVLSQPTTLSQQDRLRYLDTLSEIDELSWDLEDLSSQIAERIEGLDWDITVSPAEWKEYPDFLRTHRTATLAIYGRCVKPLELDLLNPTKNKTAK
jgi:hypothetical protein